MKFDKDTVFVEVFEFPKEGLKELSIEEIRNVVTPVKPAVPLNMELRDYVTTIDFRKEGFKGLDVKPPEKTLAECTSIKEVFDKTFMNLTLWDIRDNSVVASPNYIINTKHNQVFNVFDSIDRMKYYNFLADMMKKGRDAWKIVTARDLSFRIPYKVFVSMYSWITEEEETGRVTPIKTQLVRDLPIEEVNKILESYNISLIDTNETLTSLVMKLEAEVLTVQDIINKRFEGK